MKRMLFGTAWMMAAAAGLGALASALGQADAWAVAALALALSLPFFVPASLLMEARRPWFEGLYVAGFLARLAVLGVAMAAGRLPAASLALTMFAMELAGVAWMALAPKAVRA